MSALTKIFSETKTMTKRNLWKSMKNPDRLIENLVSPIMTMLVFVFVLGGAMSYSTDMSYVNYVMPGVLILCIGQCSTAAAIGISTDIQKGIVDRFRSMPITASSVLNGHVVESVIRSMISLLVIFLISLLVGFRPKASLTSWLLAFVLLILFTVMITWVSVAYGLFVKSAEGAGSLTMYIMLFVYLSSGFIPTQTLPTVLRVFAENQPLTSIIESLRRLLLSDPLGNYLLLAIIWCIGILVVSFIAAMRLYKNKMNR